ncbi:MAG: hypothetical protein RL316_533 [Bacteroidota bacterium]|jgi:cytidine deaminase
MKKENYQFEYIRVPSQEHLKPEDQELMRLALIASLQAYAPYSNFLVGAAARLKSGMILTGSNQENASYPVGVCAERVLLGVVASQHPQIPIDTMAITYQSKNRESKVPVSPCGMCRQALLEFENRVNHPMRLILGGAEGEVLIIDSARLLLPLAFESSYLK